MIEFKKNIVKNFKKEIIIELIKENNNYTDEEVFKEIKKYLLNCSQLFLKIKQLDLFKPLLLK